VNRRKKVSKEGLKSKGWRKGSRNPEIVQIFIGEKEGNQSKGLIKGGGING
jgi:hypothetical protein